MVTPTVSPWSVHRLVVDLRQWPAGIPGGRQKLCEVGEYDGHAAPHPDPREHPQSHQRAEGGGCS
eukprot:788060-Prorocentrum_minimum.AAC.2